MRASNHSGKTGATPVVPLQKPIFENLSFSAKKVATVLGFATSAGLAAASPMSADTLRPLGFSGASVSAASFSQNPTAADLHDREWKAVAKRGIGVEAFALESFGTTHWKLLVDEDGNRLVHAGKLRFGKFYLIARDEEDAKKIAAALKPLKGSIRTTERFGTPSVQATAPTPKLLSWMNAPSMDVESFISYAREHLGKSYRLGGNGTNSIDCSQLVVEALKKGNAVPSGFDTTAAGFYRMSEKKKISKIERGDLVFLKNASGHVNHVAIALSSPDSKGYVQVADAAKSQKAVTERKFHVSIIASAGSLPILAKAKPVEAPNTILASSAVPRHSDTIRSAKRTVESLSSTVASSIISSANAAEAPRSETKEPAKNLERPLKKAETLQKTAERAVRAPEAPTPAQTLSKKTETKVLEIVSRLPSAEQSKSIHTKLSEKSIEEQIAHYRSQAKAANDPHFAAAAEKTAVRLELAQALVQRDLIRKNLIMRAEQLKEGHPEAPRVIESLKKAMGAYDTKVERLKIAMNDAESRMRKAA